MILNGFDEASGKITDLDGGMALIDAANEIAASWTFKGMMAHWNRKHAQAAYVPSLFRTPPPEYKYGAHVLLCEQTDFLLFLKARSEEHTSELQSLMRISYAVFCLKKKNKPHE